MCINLILHLILKVRLVTRPILLLPKVQWDVVGAWIIGAVVLPTLHVLPVFLDLKIAADPALPALTQDTLPMAETVT